VPRGLCDFSDARKMSTAGTSLTPPRTA
jgi:hypothetical protein